MQFEKNKINISISLFCLFLISMFVDMKETGVIYNKMILIVIMFSMILIVNTNIEVDRNMIFFVGFIIINFMTYIYGIDNKYVLGNCATLITGLLLIIICKSMYIDEKTIIKIMKIIIIVGTIVAIYVLMNLEVNVLDNGTYYYAGSIERIIGNRNVLAMILAFAFNIVIYVRRYVEKKKVWIICGIIILTMILLTGSRKGLFMIIIPIILQFGSDFLAVEGIKNKIKIIIMVIFVTLAFTFIIFKVDFFYKVVGERVEEAIKGVITQEETKESSFNTRKQMIEKGKIYFREKPLLGYGTANYSYLYKREMGKETYSHNNYIELLVNNGIIGFLMYYIYYFSVLIKVFLKYRGEKENIIKKYYLVFLSILLTCLFLDNTMVSYNSYFIYLVIGMSLIKIDDRRSLCRYEKKFRI